MRMYVCIGVLVLSVCCSFFFGHFLFLEKNSEILKEISGQVSEGARRHDDSINEKSLFRKEGTERLLEKQGRLWKTLKRNTH